MYEILHGLEEESLCKIDYAATLEMLVELVWLIALRNKGALSATITECNIKNRNIDITVGRHIFSPPPHTTSYAFSIASKV